MNYENKIKLFITNYIKIPYNWNIEYINFYKNLYKDTTVSIVFSVRDIHSKNKNFISCEFAQADILNIIEEHNIFYEMYDGGFYVPLETTLFDLRGSKCSHILRFSKDVNF